ncbi:MAG: GNAT family N-acetyltransferase [Steroidobacter sp.]
MSPHPITITHTDVEWCEAFIRYAPRVFPRISFRKWYERGGWDEDYCAVAITAGEEIIANASLSRMTILLHGRELTGWQLGAVGVVPEHRGQGLQRMIMPRVLEFAASEDIMFLFANDDVLDFYPLFGFKRVHEVEFGADYAVTPARDRLRTLSLDSPEDRALLVRVAASASPLTELFGARNYGGVLLWYWTNFYQERLYYCAESDAILITEHEGDCLRICDVLARNRLDLRSYLPRVARAPARHIKFGFTPGEWWPDARPIGAYDESPLFVRGDHALPTVPFKFPMLAQT